MNIQEAKQEIKNALRAYFQKDGNGRYILPSVHQRPLLLMGPPGIGKTAVVEQAAREAGIGLVAYTMTHHTRQSAIGLPRIETRTYQGRMVSVTEYTLSEIVASIYDCMERTGKREGILFLDEINCVSETLAPTMSIPAKQSLWESPDPRRLADRGGGEPTGIQPLRPGV